MFPAYFLLFIVFLYLLDLIDEETFYVLLAGWAIGTIIGIIIVLVFVMLLI